MSLFFLRRKKGAGNEEHSSSPTPKIIEPKERPFVMLQKVFFMCNSYSMTSDRIFKKY